MKLSPKEINNLNCLLISPIEENILLGLEIVEQNPTLKSEVGYVLALLIEFNDAENIQAQLNRIVQFSKEEEQKFQKPLIFFKNVKYRLEDLALEYDWALFLKYEKHYVDYIKMNEDYIQQFATIAQVISTGLDDKPLAQKVYKKSLKYNDNDGWLHYQYADFLYYTIQEGEVFQDLKEEVYYHFSRAGALEMDAENTYTKLGRAYVQLDKNKEKAIYYYRKALEINPNHNECLFYLGHILTYEDAAEKADCYERVLKNRPDYTVLHNNLADIYWEHYQDYEKAISLVNEALDISRDYFTLAIGAWIHWEAKQAGIEVAQNVDTEMIITMGEECLNLKDDYTPAMTTLADIYITTNQKLEIATNYLKIVLEEDPQDERALKLKKQLKTNS